MKKQTEQVLNLTQIKALCTAPTNLHLTQRHDKLLETVLLMAYLGLWVSEAINFTWQTVPVENKTAFLVNGKGNKQRLVFNLLYDLGLDSSSIQQLLGHSQFRTTEKYLKKDVRFLLTNLQRKGFLL